MNGFIMQLIASAAVSAALVGLLLWMTKTWISERLKQAIKNEYDEKLETHKAQLKAQSDIEIERLRSQLSIAATEHEVRFSRLHEKRAEVIAETYALLKELFLRIGDYTKPFEPAGGSSRDERRKAAANAHETFQAYYVTRIIFVPKETAKKLEAIEIELVRVSNQFIFAVDMAGTPDTQKWGNIFDKLQGDIKNALGELEDEFRRLLGDPE